MNISADSLLIGGALLIVAIGIAWLAIEAGMSRRQKRNQSQ